MRKTRLNFFLKTLILLFHNTCISKEINSKEIHAKFLGIELVNTKPQLPPGYHLVMNTPTCLSNIFGPILVCFC